MARAVLVTGGCGFVGRNLVASLIGECDELWLIDDLSTGRHPDLWLPALAPGTEASGDRPRVYSCGATTVRFLRADLLELLVGELDTIRGSTSPIAWPRFAEAYHLASIVGGRAKIEGDPLHVGLDLAIDSVFFLWAWRAERVERVLYASSSAAYPIDLQAESSAVALREDSVDFASARIGMPDMSYGWSKLTGEYLAYLLATRHGVPACSVRPFSGYGEDQDLAYPIPAIAARAAGRENPLVVWGSGRQGRDFVHIDDCIVGMRVAVTRIEDGSGVNLGSGQLTSFLEVAALIAELAGYEPEIRGTESGPVGVHARYADTTKARQRLGWKPTISLKEGLARVLAAREQPGRSGADAPR